METLWQDIRYGARMLAKSPGFTVVAVLTLALGIGANTAIFSVVYGVLLKPLPYPDPDRIAMVWMDNQRLGVREDITSWPNYIDWRDRNQTFQALAGVRELATTLTGLGDPERITAATVTANFFEVVGVQPALGQAFTTAHETEGNDRVVLLSHGLWQRRFGGRPDVLNEMIHLGGEPHTVIGVMPRDFAFPRDVELWAPLAPPQRRREARFSFWLPVVGRMKPGVTPAAAQADMDRVAASVVAENQEMVGFGIFVNPLDRQVTGGIRPALLLLLGAVGLVLLIACVNVANLMLARAGARSREMSVRAALGAGRLRLARQMLTESTLLSLGGAALGVLLAVWGVDLLKWLHGAELPRAGEVALDGTVLAFTAALAVATGLLFGLLPALAASRTNLSEALKEAGGRSLASPRSRTRSALVVAELGLAIVVLASAGLLVQSFFRMRAVDPGFRPDGLLSVNVSIPANKYPQPAQGVEFFRALVERVEGLPGVEGAAVTTGVFLRDLPNSSTFNIEGRPEPAPEDRYELPFDRVSPGYFETVGMRLVAGRLFTAQDGPGSTPVAIVNEAMARRFFADPEAALGNRFTFGDPTPDARWITIVGVVADMKRSGPHRPVRADSYFPIAVWPSTTLTLVMRSAEPAGALLPAVRTLVREMEPEAPVYSVATLEERFA